MNDRSLFWLLVGGVALWYLSKRQRKTDAVAAQTTQAAAIQATQTPQILFTGPRYYGGSCLECP